MLQRYREGGLLLIYAAVGAGMTAWIGQDLNWDFLNYHLYNAYMLMDGRIARDVHAAGVQTFLNPLLDLPIYGAFRMGVPPRVLFMLLGALHGCALFAVHRITDLILPSMPRRHAFGLAMLAALTAALGAGFRSEVGNTMHDLTIAVPILGALWLVLSKAATRFTAAAAVVPGFIIGAAAGSKLAVLPLCIGLAAAVMTAGGLLRTRLVRLSSFGIAGTAGLLLTSGYWMWIMYTEFGSPLFPFFNRVFGSAFAPNENFVDPRFFPRGVMETMLYPFLWVELQTRVTENAFRDARIAAGLLAIGMLTVLWLVNRLTSTNDVEHPVRWPESDMRLVLLIVFWIVAYVVWLHQFSIYRYIVVLEALSSALVVAALTRVLLWRAGQFATALLLCGAMSLWAVPPNWGRVPWSTSYLGVDTARLQKYEGATIVLYDFPVACLAPLFPRSSTFVRVIGNWGLSEDTSMWLRVQERLAQIPAEKGYVMQRVLGDWHAMPTTLLEQFGFELDGTCETHTSFLGPFRVCGLRRRAAG